MVNIEFKLTPWRLEFAGEFASIANNYNIAKYMRDTFPHPYTEVTAEWFIRDCIGDDPGHSITYAITSDGKVIGSIGVFMRDDVYSKSCDLGYFIAEEYWGRGIATGAIRQICAEAFKKLDTVRIIAEPFADNTGSRKALEKAGFTLEGILKKSVYKLGEFHDSCIYALVR